MPERTVFHCFTGGPDEARRCLDLGGYLSFSGIVTFKAADDLRAAAALCPLDRLLVETDSPYLAPVPHRGEANRPALLPLVGGGGGRGPGRVGGGGGRGHLDGGGAVYRSAERRRWSRRVLRSDHPRCGRVTALRSVRAMHDPSSTRRAAACLFVVLVTGLGSDRAWSPVEAPPASRSSPTPPAPHRCGRQAAGPPPVHHDPAELEAPATMLVRGREDHHRAADHGAAHHRRPGAPPTTARPPPPRPPPPARPTPRPAPPPGTRAAPPAAAPTLTLLEGTVVTVTAVSSGRQVTCTVNDRGPFGPHIIDLSPTGFQALAPLSSGVVSVRITW